MFAVANNAVVARPQARRAAAPKRGALLVVAQGKGGEEGGKAFGNDVVGLVSKNANFAMLGSAITKAREAKLNTGLTGALSGPGPFTLFAPNDDAFIAATKKLGITKLELMSLPNLGEILKCHVINGAVTSDQLKEGMEVETLAGKKIKISLAGGASISGSKVKKADVKASNGIVHAVESVILL